VRGGVGFGGVRVGIPLDGLFLRILERLWG
jgi:hypothetical protein